MTATAAGGAGGGPKGKRNHRMSAAQIASRKLTRMTAGGITGPDGFKQFLNTALREFDTALQSQIGELQIGVNKRIDAMGVKLDGLEAQASFK